jgi:hypothetical protein
MDWQFRAAMKKAQPVFNNLGLGLKASGSFLV